MKFMLLCYDDEDYWENVGPAAHEAAIGEAVTLTRELNDKGQYMLSAPLAHSRNAKSVRVRDGQSVVTDGPFAETREVLGGFHLIDVPDLDAAIRAAARHPGAKVGTVEIRPVMEIAGLPD